MDHTHRLASPPPLARLSGASRLLTGSLFAIPMIWFGFPAISQAAPSLPPSRYQVPLEPPLRDDNLALPLEALGRSQADFPGRALPADGMMPGALAGSGARASASNPTGGGSPEPYADNPGLDVQHYHFAFSLIENRDIAGHAALEVKALEAGVERLELDLVSTLTVKDVSVDGVKVEPILEPNRVIIPVPATTVGQLIQVSLGWSGTVDLFEELGLGFFQVDGVPWFFSLNEPFGAHSWLPVVEDVADKATWSLEITVPEGLTAVSNGVQSQDPTEDGAGHVTWYWETQYPNSVYLLAITIGDLLPIEETYLALDGSSMPVTHYVLPSSMSTARSYFAPTVEMLTFLAETFGEYPFLAEKYGHAEFGFSGYAMEHATLTSMASSVIACGANCQSTILHEAAHQWFGDQVTMKTWTDIWLNESFATYCEALWAEYNNPEALLDYGRDLWQARYDGSITAENPLYPFDDTNAIYPRGARVLHMLRHLMGDEHFFSGLRSYLSRYRYANANTADLQAVMEEAYGESLSWFFDQWIMSPGRPQILSWFQQDGSTLKLYLKQVQSHRLYKLKVDADVLIGETTTTFSDLWIDGSQSLTVIELPVSGQVSWVTLDPAGVQLAYTRDLGPRDATDLPVLQLVYDVRSGIDTLTSTLVMTSSQDLSSYSLSWDPGDGSGEVSGASLRHSYPYTGTSSSAYYIPRPVLRSGSGEVYTYPWLEVRAYSPDRYWPMRDGELNYDGLVTGSDLGRIAAARGATDLKATLAISGDVNQDGKVDDADVKVAATNLGVRLFE